MTTAQTSRSRLLLRVLLYGAAAAALWSTLRRADLGGAARLVGSVGPAVLLVLVPYLLGMLAQSVGYSRIIGALGAASGRRRPSIAGVLSVVLSSEAVLMSVPAGSAVGEAVSPYLLNRRSGVPLPLGAASAASRRTLMILANALYVGVAVVVGASSMQAVSRAVTGVPGLPWMVAAVGVGMLVASSLALWALFSGSVASRSHGLLSRLPSARLRAVVARWRAGFAAMDAHLSSALGARADLAIATAIFLAGWLLESVEALLILRLLGVRMPFAQVLSFEVVVSLVRSLAFFVPAGLGIQDAGYVAFLTALGVPDPAKVAVAFVLVKRAKEMFWVAVGLALFAVIGGNRQALHGGAHGPASERR
jgi:uncharacterized protein (TIRG00374 family)